MCHWQRCRCFVARCRSLSAELKGFCDRCWSGKLALRQAGAASLLPSTPALCCRLLPGAVLLPGTVLQDMVKRPVPFKSPSAVLQEHVNPEHAAHYAAVNANKDINTPAPGDLPTSTSAPQK